MIMLLAACDGTSPGIDPVETSPTTPDTSSPANTSIPADTSGSSDTPDTVTFTKGETTEYVIVIGKNAASAEKDAADKLSRAFKTYLDIDIKITIDLVNEALGYREIPTEIVVGKTSRGNACGWDASQYRNNDYFIGVKDGKIYITGATADATMNGVSAFIRKNLFGVGESLTVSSENNLCFTDDYAIKSITLEGQEMKHMSVAYTGHTGLVRQAASVLAEKLTQRYRLGGAGYSGRRHSYYPCRYSGLCVAARRPRGGTWCGERAGNARSPERRSAVICGLQPL